MDNPLFWIIGIAVIAVLAVIGRANEKNEKSNRGININAQELQALKYLLEEQAKMVISDIEHDYMVEFTDEQWERFLKADNPALAAFKELPKGIPPLEEFKENLFEKGNQFLYGFGLNFETANEASVLLKKEIDSMDNYYLVLMMKKINSSATDEYAFMRNTINYDSLASGLLHGIAEEMESDELMSCVMHHAKKKGWLDSSK